MYARGLNYGKQSGWSEQQESALTQGFLRGIPAISQSMQFAPGTDPLSLVVIFFKLMKGRTLFPSMLAAKLFEESECHCLSLRVLLSWQNVLEPLRAE